MLGALYYPVVHMMKTCTRCGAAKDTAEFGPRKQSSDGLKIYCRPCVNAKSQEAYRRDLTASRAKAAAKGRERRANNPEHYNAVAAKSRAKHRIAKPLPTEEQLAATALLRAERKKAARRRTYLKHKDAVLAVAALYRAGHKEQERASRAAHYERNKEHIARVSKVYREKRPDVYAAAHARRNAAKLRATAPWADRCKVARFYAEAARLTAETGVEHHVDHKIPLQSRVVCGLHVETNLQVLTKTANLRKLNKFDPTGVTA